MPILRFFSASASFASEFLYFSVFRRRFASRTFVEGSEDDERTVPGEVCAGRSAGTRRCACLRASEDARLTRTSPLPSELTLPPGRSCGRGTRRAAEYPEDVRRTFPELTVFPRRCGSPPCERGSPPPPCVFAVKRGLCPRPYLISRSSAKDKVPLSNVRYEIGHTAAESGFTRCIPCYFTPSHASAQNSAVINVKTPTIFSSLHPHFSKWWWIGAILKSRFPWVILKYPT